jgi:hypothetical protein
MLDGSDPLGRIRDLLATRESAYSIADHRIDTNELSPVDVVKEIVDLLSDRWNRFSSTSESTGRST